MQKDDAVADARGNGRPSVAADRAVHRGVGAHRLTALAVGLGSPLAYYLLIRLLPDLRTAGHLAALLRNGVLITASAAWLAWVWYRRLLSGAALGLRWPRFADLGWGSAAAVASVVAGVSTSMSLFQLGFEVENGLAVTTLASWPAWLVLLMVVTAATTEEVAFRSLLIAGVEGATGSRTLAFVLSIAAFALAHWSGFGAVKMAVLVTSGVAVPALFLLRRSLAACIFAHLVVDLLATSPFLFAGGR